jgi:MFS superfamily sulfate permease-like transporter
VLLAACLTVLCSPSIKQVELPDNLLSVISLPSLEGLDMLGAWQPLLLAAASIAFIASAETLLSATAVDQMHQGPRTRYDRELAAQGVGNLVSGLLGGLPMTGVIVRSAANVEAGARSSKSEILHGVWLLVFVCLFPFLLRVIPTASLAAILVFTGYKLVDQKAIRTLAHYGKSEVFIYAATVIMIVAADLLTGVVVGFALSVIKLVITFSHLHVHVDDDSEQRRTVLHLEGTATFIRLPKLAAALEAVPPDRELHVHFEHLDYIDHACLDLLMNWEKQHSASGGSLVIDWDRLTARFREFGRNGKSSVAAEGNGAAAERANPVVHASA